jgi:hypothetical protein
MNLLPYVKAAAVTTSDSTVLKCSGFFVGVAGNVNITPRDGSTAVLLKGCLAGTIYPIACDKIMSTSTTATDIVALY